MSRAVDSDVARVPACAARACRRASRAWRRATARTRTTCRARPVATAPSPRPRAGSILHDVRSRRARTRPAAGGPTRAGARRTRGGCSPSSRGRSARGAGGGSARGRRARRRSPARRARPCRQNHCSETSGSMRAPRAAAVPDGVAVRLLVAQRAALAQLGHARSWRLLGGQPGPAPPAGRGHAAVEADRRERRRARGGAPISKSIGSWPGRDLQRARAEVRLDVGVGDDRHRAVDQRHDRACADEVAVARVVRVHGDGDVGQDRHRPHGGDGHDLAAALDGVGDVVQHVVDLAVLDLEVGDRGRAAARTS